MSHFALLVHIICLKQATFLVSRCTLHNGKTNYILSDSENRGELYIAYLPAILLVSSLEASMAVFLSLMLKSIMFMCPLQWRAVGGAGGAHWTQHFVKLNFLNIPPVPARQQTCKQCLTMFGRDKGEYNTRRRQLPFSRKFSF